MIRRGLSALGGISLALLLFWLLALLVAPPEQEIEVLERPMPLSTIEAPEPVEEEVTEPSPEAAAPPEAAPPPPRPEPAPPMESPIALPEPELPPEAFAPLELDTSLPELTETLPAPDPQPQPDPAPSPEPAPESRSAATEASAEASAEPVNQAPVDVGRIAPTSRVPPEYPARAQRRGLEGHVELEFVIRPDGRVDASTIRVTDSRPRHVFDDAARQAVARWRFESAEGLRRARQRLEFQLR
ncbi:energy transducer TonB [Halomonas sp. C05BenzN]|uniref:energy transducer TonB n=1 Tax=Halomonas sp. C05BenzN TaxID=3411041 RepID=UPI003B93FA4C